MTGIIGKRLHNRISDIKIVEIKQMTRFHMFAFNSTNTIKGKRVNMIIKQVRPKTSKASFKSLVPSGNFNVLISNPSGKTNEREKKPNAIGLKKLIDKTNFHQSHPERILDRLDAVFKLNFKFNKKQTRAFNKKKMATGHSALLACSFVR